MSESTEVGFIAAVLLSHFLGYVAQLTKVTRHQATKKESDVQCTLVTISDIVAHEFQQLATRQNSFIKAMFSMTGSETGRVNRVSEIFKQLNVAVCRGIDLHVQSTCEHATTEITALLETTVKSNLEDLLFTQNFLRKKSQRKTIGNHKKTIEINEKPEKRLNVKRQ